MNLIAPLLVTNMGAILLSLMNHQGKMVSYFTNLLSHKYGITHRELIYTEIDEVLYVVYVGKYCKKTQTTYFHFTICALHSIERGNTNWLSSFGESVPLDKLPNKFPAICPIRSYYRSLFSMNLYCKKMEFAFYLSPQCGSSG